MTDFTHLHVHSHYTLLESPITVGHLLQAVKDKGMDAVALTDRGNLFGAYEFYAAAKEAGVKGILGCQVNLAPLGIQEKGRDMHQLVLLAQDAAGYRNLAKLVSLGWLEGYYYEPRVDLELIAPHAAGLVCLTGAGRDGFLNRHLAAGAEDEAHRQLGTLVDIFGRERLFVELTDHHLEGAPGLITGNLALAKHAGVGVVATNWVHYLEADDHAIHDVQLAIQRVTTVDDPGRKRMPSHEYYLKTPDQMAELFRDHPEAIANTRRVVELCAGSKIPSDLHLPKFPCPPGLDVTHLLRQLVEDGMRHRYGPTPTAEARERLEFELETISKMGFEAYFLIVADFITWAKGRGIPVGPGRGSAAGSIVSYCLGITDICPLRYGLLFERFLNPGRKSMPDIDIDFCKDRRNEVITYVAEKYGRDAVTQIMTLGTMKARMAIKDVARAYHWTPEEAQELANLVPEDPSGKHDLQVCLGRRPLNPAKPDDPAKPDQPGRPEWGVVEPMLKRYEDDERTRQVLDAALKLERLGRSLGVHACGVIIAPGPVSDYVPVCVVKGKPATQFNMIQVEKCGLLKMDFLGLKTMSVLKKAADIVRETEGRAIDYGAVPLDDRATYELLGRGDTLGVFQCESQGFQELIKLMRPDRFEDMIALVALYRPGPLMANMHIDYCDRKAGRAKVDYPHPVLEKSLQETFGLYIYQEQVMNISRELCGFSPADADDLRKAMGKKDAKLLTKLKEQFIDGAWKRHQFDKKKGAAMWDNILGFASYCFNKSHSACYGLIAYWTAYMKANHYAAFMTANLIYEMDNKDKMTKFVEELRGSGIPVLPPDINESGWEFTVVQGFDVRRPAATTGAPVTAETPPAERRTPKVSAIRFGFGGVKAVGEGAAQKLIEERTAHGPYASLYDLCERGDTRTVNKRVVESLIKVGALDSLHPNRRALYEAQDRAFDRGNRLARTRAQNQQTLFDSFETDATFRQETQGYPQVPDWSVLERLAFEKALTGYWISSHPVVESRADLSGLTCQTSRDLAAIATGAPATIAAVVLDKRVIRTKAGKTMAVLSLEDQFGRFEGVLFPGSQGRRDEAGAYDRFAAECEPDTVAVFGGTVERRVRRAAPRPQPAAGDDDETLPPEAAEEEADQPAIEELPSLRIMEVVPAGLVLERLGRAITVAAELGESETDLRRLDDTETLFKEHPGTCPVAVEVLGPGDASLSLRLGERWRVHPSRELVTRLRAIWGERRVTVGVENLNGRMRDQRGSGAYPRRSRS